MQSLCVCPHGHQLCLLALTLDESQGQHENKWVLLLAGLQAEQLEGRMMMGCGRVCVFVCVCARVCDRVSVWTLTHMFTSTEVCV